MATTTTTAPTDIIKDPVTGNQYYRTSPTESYKPYVPPTTTTASPGPSTSTSAPATDTSTPTDKTEEAKLLTLGVTKEQLAQLNTPEGLDPISFQSLIDSVETKLKTNNELVTQRSYLIKQLYDSKLTKDELSQLPPEIQRVVKTGDKNTIELQLRLLNDQIAGRGNTLSQSIHYLTDGYQTAAQQAEDQKQNAINNVLKFVGEYGSNASKVLASLYGPEYLDKLKSMGIDIENFSSLETLSEKKKREEGAGTLLTDTQIQTGAVNARLSIDAFKVLPETVQSYFYRNPTLVADDGTEVSFADWIDQMVSAVNSGDVTVAEAVQNAEDSGMPSEVVDYVKSKINGTSAPTPKVGGGILGGIWNAVKSAGNWLLQS